MRRNLWTLVVAVIACSMLISTPVSAQESNNLVRFGAGWYSAIGDADDIVDNGVAIWVSYERRYSEKLGFEILAAYSDYDPIFDLFGRDIALTPLVLSVNYYVKSNEKFEFYVAPTIGFAQLDVDWMGDSESESGLSWGAALGVDIPFGKDKWVVALSGRYLTADLDGANFDNIIAHAGVGYRF